MPKKLKRHRLKPAVFPSGVKFVKFSSLDNLETSLKFLKTFLEREVQEKPKEGTYVLGTHFIKFIPEDRRITGAWQVSTILGKYAVLYNYSEVLRVFVSQRLTYHPDVLAVIEHFVQEVQNAKISKS